MKERKLAEGKDMVKVRRVGEGKESWRRNGEYGERINSWCRMRRVGEESEMLIGEVQRRVGEGSKSP